MKNKKGKPNKIGNNQIILINRYSPSDSIIFSQNYKSKLENQINYVKEFPPIIKNRMNKRLRSKSSKHLISSKRTIKPENIIKN